MFPPYYNETISQIINNKIRECSNKNNVSKKIKGERIVYTNNMNSKLTSNSKCNLEDCAECIIKAKITDPFVFGSSVRNDKNEYFKKIKDTINNLLSNFDSEQDKYGKISECICNSHCNEEFKTNKKCESNKHKLY